MKDKRTSKKQTTVYNDLVRFLERKTIEYKGNCIKLEDRFVTKIKQWEITLELEKRVPNTRRSADILMTVHNDKDNTDTTFAIEYDCLQWHRRWIDEEKTKALIKENVKLLRIQTYKMIPDSKKIWAFISHMLKNPEVMIMYYQLSDFDEDVWTGKKFRDFRTGKFARTEPVFDYY